MKIKYLFAAFMLPVMFGTIAFADQIILKNGQRYSGKFLRGDAYVVEFRILDRVQSFNTAEVGQIIFQEPELATPAPTPTAAARAAQPAAQATAKPQPAATQPVVQPAAVPVPAVGDATVTFPEGTALTIRTTAPIDTDRNKVGDEFDAVLDEPLMSGNQVIVPRGTEVKGTIAYARASGKLTGQSELILELTSLKVNGKSYVVRTSDYSEVGANRSTQTAKTVGGVAALGAIIGAVAGGGKGAAVGAATGAAVGTGVQVLTKGQIIKVPAETLLQFKLEHALVLDRQ